MCECEGVSEGGPHTFKHHYAICYAFYYNHHLRTAAGSWEEKRVLPVSLQILQTGLQVI